MKLCVDVHYADDGARAAGVGFVAWTDAEPALEIVRGSTSPPAPYEPGQFYKRELPHILAVLAEAPRPLDLVIIDGQVWLDAGRPGLGAHLHEAARVPVVGVAKSAFREGVAVPVRRGGSARPLYVSAAGIDPAVAAERVREMHGEHRIPTLLKRVDRLARGS